MVIPSCAASRILEDLASSVQTLWSKHGLCWEEGRLCWTSFPSFSDTFTNTMWTSSAIPIRSSQTFTTVRRRSCIARRLDACMNAASQLCVVHCRLAGLLAYVVSNRAKACPLHAWQRALLIRRTCWPRTISYATSTTSITLRSF